MKKIGQLLKQSRESQNLSLEDISGRTKIHAYKLKAIEEGDAQALPAKVFVIGLIKSYARELKMDNQHTNELCEQAFSENLEQEEPVNLVNTDEPAETKPMGLFQIPKFFSILASVVVSLVLIFIIFLVMQKMDSYSKEVHIPQLNNSTPPLSDQNNQTEELNIKEDTPTPQPAEKKEPPAKASNKVIQKNKIKQNQTEASPESTSPLPAVVIPDETTTNPPEITASQVVYSDNKLVVTALEPVRLEIVWADGYVQVMLLKSQETKTLIFSTPIKMRINNGGVVQVSLNESEAKVPGTLNQPIELSYP